MRSRRLPENRLTRNGRADPGVQAGMTRSARGAAVALAVLALAGCARPGPGPPPVADRDPDGIVRTAGCATATSPPATSIAGTPQPANQNELDALAGRVQPYAQAHFAEVYAGLALRSEQERIRVYRKPSADFDAWIVGTFAADCVEVVDARYSERELRVWVDRVAADMPGWQAQGIPVNSVSGRIDGSGIEVGTTDVERVKRELAQRYGPDAPITVVYADAVVPAVGSS
jgi:hypothetical protein